MYTSATTFTKSQEKGKKSHRIKDKTKPNPNPKC